MMSLKLINKYQDLLHYNAQKENFLHKVYVLL